MGGVYVRGLLLDGERKSIEPMAARLGESDQDLSRFVGQSPWSADGLPEALAETSAQKKPAAYLAAGTPHPPNCVHPSERTMSLVSHPTPSASHYLTKHY